MINLVPIHSNQIMFEQDFSYSHMWGQIYSPRRSRGTRRDHKTIRKSFFVPFVCFAVKSLFGSGLSGLGIGGCWELGDLQLIHHKKGGHHEI